MMHCPRCNLEYQDDAVQCSDCEVTLVPGPRPEPLKQVHPEVELERVYVAGDPATIPIIKSLLDDAEIEYLVKGEGVQDLFGWGRIGTGFNFVTGPVEFFVASENASTAREILGHLMDEVPDEAPDEPSP